MAQRGIVDGFADNSFRPAENLTRAQVAAMFVRALQLLTQAGDRPDFSDVTSEHWAAPAIAAAARAGLIQGFPDGTFRPDAVITRAQAAAMVFRLSRQETADARLPLAQDVAPDHWAARAAAVASAAGLIDLKDELFVPDAPSPGAKWPRPWR